MYAVAILMYRSLSEALGKASYMMIVGTTNLKRV
jgi:hypothetical protein